MSNILRPGQARRFTDKAEKGTGLFSRGFGLNKNKSVPFS